MALLALIGNEAISQTTDPVNAQLSEYTPQEKLLDATIICLDAIEAPTKYNEFAKQFVNEVTFPKASTSISHDELQQSINDWLVTRPSTIEKILVERKKAHDILYGPRPY